MKKGGNAAEVLGSDDGLNNAELTGGRRHEGALILKAAPRSRKGELISRGAREIRCIYCRQIKSLAGAEDFEEGWVCEDCVSG
jgi:hypothetical protein